MKDGKPRNRPPDFYRQFSMAMELPFLLVGGLVVGGGLGYLLDRWLHTAPVLMIVLGILGFFGGIWDVIKIVSRPTKDKNNGSP